MVPLHDVRPARRGRAVRRTRRTGVAVAAAAMAAATVLTGCGAPAHRGADDSPSASIESATDLVAQSFSGADRLVTNEYAHWNPGASDAVRSPIWEVTSGSLFARGGVGWSGRASHGEVDARSIRQTNSAIFRATMRARLPADISFSGRFRVVSIVPVPENGEKAADMDWRGLHLWLHYRSPQDLYAVSIARHDGQVTIKRKSPGGDSNGGSYQTLASTRGGLTPGAWHAVTVTIAHRDGATELRLTIDGAQVLSTLHQERDAGAETTVGVRGDDTEFEMTQLRVDAP